MDPYYCSGNTCQKIKEESTTDKKNENNFLFHFTSSSLDLHVLLITCSMFGLGLFHKPLANLLQICFPCCWSYLRCLLPYL